ncbi:hypothetical protein [Stenotrophomonas maltophilia]|uniref:hypothetical protein n=1 Tax=Stenotrophomonas maltophilia TaxID=40324 RepID=UPI000D0CFF49|nr:hypothetical protein [Stenotrophomonas maltophilia]PSM13252.1 hypothetical protein CV100_13120 [Stenotrophomonas maltophilia]
MASDNGSMMFTLGVGLFAVLLALGAYAVRRISARDPSGRHWLLRSLALLSPLCLLTGAAIGLIGPHLNGEREPAHAPGLLGASMILVLAGALTLPVLWRMLVHRHLGRPANALPFFHASRSSLLVLFVLALIYLKASGKAVDELMPWLTGPGLWPALVRATAQAMQIAMISVVLTLSLMAIRALMIAFARRLVAPFRRSPGL